MPLLIMPNKTFISLFLLVTVCVLSVKGQSSTVSPDHLKSNLIQFLKNQDVINDESKIGMSFYLIDLNTSVDRLNSHVVFPVEIKSEPANTLQIGFYKFGISSPHLEPYLVVVSKESFDILSDYSVPAVLNELESFMTGKSLDYEKQVQLAKNVFNMLGQRHRILESATPVEDSLIFNNND